MSIDRAEINGTGAAVLFHVALIGALSTSLAHINSVPEPPSMAVEFVDEIALEAAAPTPIATPAPAEQSPTVEDVPPLDQPAPPPPTPRAAPTPAPVPAPRPLPKAAPNRPAPAKAAPARPAPRKSMLGDDFLKGIPDGTANAPPARPSAPTFNAKAKADIGSALLRQAKPCADQQPYLGEGANTLRLRVNLKFNRAGRLARPPAILGISGDGELKAKYGDLLEDQVRRIFTQCAPFRLPADLYDTPSGGWNDFTFSYRVE